MMMPMMMMLAFVAFASFTSPSTQQQQISDRTPPLAWSSW